MNGLFFKNFKIICGNIHKFEISRSFKYMNISNHSTKSKKK